MATPAERDLESPTVRRVGAAASIERDAAAAQAGTMAIMISKDENKGGELARTFEGSSRQASVGGQNPPPRGGLAIAGDQRYLPRDWPEGRHNVDRRERLGDGDL